MMTRTKLTRLFRWAIVIVTTWFTYCWLFSYFILKFEYDSTATDSHLSTAHLESHNSTRLVLLWTDLFQEKYWHQESYFNISEVETCPAGYRCRFTRQQDQINQASLVAFHLYDTTRGKMPVRHEDYQYNQSWVFVTGESPVNFYYQNPSFYPKLLDNYFDAAISYKYESPFPIFASSFRPRSLDSSKREQALNKLSVKKKTKSIIWIVSNCYTFSHREQYVEELSKWISVDIYGKCGKKCDMNRDCHIDLDQYYFYLSFENSRCNSYITEKFWNVLNDRKNRLVPIVMGAKKSNYTHIAPNNSFIHIDDFSTPRQLAEYLSTLMENSDQYLNYIKWREVLEIIPLRNAGWKNLLCPLCYMAHHSSSRPMERLKFSTWFDPTTECHKEDAQTFSTCKQATLSSIMKFIHKTQCPG